MPSKKKIVIGTEASLPQIPSERLGRAATGPVAAGAAESVMRGFKKAVVGRAPGAGMSHRPGCRPGTAKPGQLVGHRNGRSGKTALAGDGPLRIGVPRGRDGSSGTHSPALATRSRPCARGMTVRGILGFPGEMCGAGVPPGFAGGVAGAVMAEVAARRVRPPEPMCPAVFSGAPRAKVREDAAVRGKPVYLAPGVPPGGTRRIPGPRVESAGGAKFWMKVLAMSLFRNQSDRFCDEDGRISGIGRRAG